MTTFFTDTRSGLPYKTRDYAAAPTMAACLEPAQPNYLSALNGEPRT